MNTITVAAGPQSWVFEGSVGLSMTPYALAAYASPEGKENGIVPMSAGKQKPSAWLSPALNFRVQDQSTCLALEPHPALDPLGPVVAPSFPKLLRAMGQRF